MAKSPRWRPPLRGRKWPGRRRCVLSLGLGACRGAGAASRATGPALPGLGSGLRKPRGHVRYSLPAVWVRLAPVPSAASRRLVFRACPRNHGQAGETSPFLLSEEGRAVAGKRRTAPRGSQPGRHLSEGKRSAGKRVRICHGWRVLFLKDFRGWGCPPLA